MSLAGRTLNAESDVGSWLVKLLMALAALSLFRLAALYVNQTDLFFDEAQYWSWSLEPSFGYYSKPPMIAWLIGLSTGGCGISEFCVRLPSLFIHAGTAIGVFALGWKLFNAKTGFYSGVVFATLPGVSLSAGIISTDVPLLFFWSWALFGFIYLIEDDGAWWPALLIGAAMGLGLNAKYAMAYFVLCALIYFAIWPERRHMLRDLRWWSAVAIALVLIAPNLMWNYENSFATFAHTAQNARWTGSIFNPIKALEFFGSQFGVFGPILFAGLLIIARRAYRGEVSDEADKLLLAFALPVIVIVTVQAFISRAHANWAAVSYVAATVLVTSTMIREYSWGWLRVSLLIHISALFALAVLSANAGSFRLPNGQDPFARTLGWENLANATKAQLNQARKDGKPYGGVLTLDRSVTAELLYYMRDDKTPIRSWRAGARPNDHFQLTRAYQAKVSDPILLVVVGGIPTVVADRFEVVEYVAVENVPAGAGPPRRVTFGRLSGFKRR